MIFPPPAHSSGGYQIGHSLRLRSSASGYLSRLFTTPTNNLKWTWSAWVKRGTLGGTQTLLHGNGDNTGNNEGLILLDGDSFRIYSVSGGATQMNIVSTRVLRDPSAWTHLVAVYDSAQAVAADRVKLYVNNEQVTSFSTNTIPAQNASPNFNKNGMTHEAGIRLWGSDLKFDGYLSNIHFIDGQALTPTSFGETNSDGVWVPKAYTGTYGTNGFYLPFNDGTSTTTLGYDRSGNANNWTASGISLTAGATYDWMVDTPTNNFAVLNPLQYSLMSGGTASISNGNLTASDAATSYGCYGIGSIAVSTAKWYWETTLTTAGGAFAATGIVRTDTIVSATNYAGYNYNAQAQKISASIPFSTSSGAAYGASFTAGDVIGVALDMDAGTLEFFKNNVSQGVAFTGISGTYSAAVGDAQNATQYVWNLNFGQRPFTYTPPTGFKALCTANRATGSVTTSGTFTGNLSTNGPFVWLNGNPTTMTINGNAVTWGTHADKTAGGFKVRTASASYNASGSNTYTVTVTGELFGDIAHAPNTAQGNP